MTADHLKTIQPGELYYAGSTVSRVAGKDGVKPSQPMVDGVFVPNEPKKLKAKVYKGGSHPVEIDADLLVEHYDYSN